MKKNTFAGIAVSCICIGFVLRGINFSEVAACFRSIQYLYLIPVLLMVFGNLYLRSYRWGVMIENLVRLDQWTLFRFSSIGFMAIGVLPARLGEFVRPYLVKQHSGVRMSATMATVVLERVFDLLTLMVFLFVVLIKIPLPPEIFKAGITMLTISLVLLTVLIILGTKRDFSARIIAKVLGLLPDRIGKPAAHLADSFLEGLQLLPDVKKTAWVLLLSLVIWLLQGLSAYFMFYAFGMDLSIYNALAVLAIVALGVMIPAAPGFIGTYHYACILGLTAFGIAKSEAFSYAVALWIMQMIPVVLIGLVLLPFQKLTFGGLLRRAEAVAEDTGAEEN
jgi:glycosyltransferase 2 family protein